MSDVTHEPDRVAIELTFPLRTQFSTVRVRLEHSFYPEEKGEARIKVCDFLADKVAELVKREGERMEHTLRPELTKDGRRY